jgi:hypothetical protein
MLDRVYSCAVIGLDSVVVEVEVDYTAGFPGMRIVGLPDAAIQESRERVQAAVRNAGVPFPRKRLVVNLASASVRKEGPAYYLPFAVGVLLYTGMLPPGARLADLPGQLPTVRRDEPPSIGIHTIEHIIFMHYKGEKGDFEGGDGCKLANTIFCIFHITSTH